MGIEELVDSLSRRCDLFIHHVTKGASVAHSVKTRRLVMGPYTAWVRVSLSPENLHISISSNFIVVRVPMPCRQPVVFPRHFYPHLYAVTRAL